jgi:hypothetical protein
MPEMREVFDMVTQKIRPEPGFAERQIERQRRRQRTQRIAAYVVTGAIAAVAVASVLVALPGDERTPAAEPPFGARLQNELDAQEAVLGFLDAYRAFDGDAALSYVAEGAAITSASGDGSPRDFRLGLRWLEAMGYRQHRGGPCQMTSHVGSSIAFECLYEWHALGSDDLGLGPYDGVFSFNVNDDGRITRVDTGLNYADGFSPQVWEPFAEWVSMEHPDEAVIMYTDDSQTNGRLTPESFRLWERLSREYVRETG